MIHFKSVKWKNFLSTGNYFTEVQLDRSPSTLIVGHNGAGKSTLLDALSFALFGKPHRDVKKMQLVNTINDKNCEVEVEFKVGSSEFRIVRGLKPNKFEIYQNGNMINQTASVRDYQKFLEQNILKLNHKSFHQVVVLGSSSFIPFMQLATTHRREVIEDLLDIQIFGKMNQILREKSTKVKEELKDNEYQLDLIKEKISLQRSYIRDVQNLNSEQQKQKQDELQELQAQVEDLQEQNSTLSEGLTANLQKVNDELGSLNNKKLELQKYETGIKSGIKRVVSEAKFFEENDTCPTCAQEIEDEFKQTKLSEAQKKARELQEGVEKCTVEIQSAEQSIGAATGILGELTSKQQAIEVNNRSITNFQLNIKRIEEEINKLTDSTSEISEANQKLADLLESKETTGERKLELVDQRNYFTVIGEMLKDSGIKTKVIKQYLPVMNKLINHYLQVMDFYVSFNLDESFNETIKSRYRDTFNYASFSEGEKQRIDLALLFTWRQIARMKNSASTNLLVLDETFDSSLDNDGIENLLKILNTLEEGTNTFIISHKGDILSDKFRSKIEFVKDRNFSKMALGEN